MHIGKRIKYLRKEKKLSQLDVCEGIVSSSHFSNIESGRYEASKDILFLLAERLQVPNDYLVLSQSDSEEINRYLDMYEQAFRTGIKESDQFIKKYQQRLTYIPSITQELSYLIIYCSHYLRKGDLSKVEKPYDQISLYLAEYNLKSLSQEVRYKYHYVSALYDFFKRDYSSSYHHFQLALDNVYRQEDQAVCLFNIGLVFFKIKDYYRSLSYVKEAKELYIDLKHLNSTVNAYILIGNIHIELQDYPTAKTMLTKGYDLALKEEFIEEQTKILNNLGTLEQKKGNYDQSIEHFSKSLDKKWAHYDKEDLYDLNSLYSSYFGLLTAHLLNQHFDTLRQLIKQADKYCIDEIQRFKVQVIEAQMEYELGNDQVYETKMEEAIDYFYQHSLWDQLENIGNHFSDYLSSKRKYKKANEYLSIELEVLKKLYKERLL
ncbi:hypothetical protein CR194_15940 [Salipaludibacillus keqinensis]|uniref:HTH cro/C1-type domain-containing protein n=1 Tax=Salipaludibacillus keqinensis TaxID=2045207 RepID=A0A323TI54_9BACI|nr:helix-turn-helix transcriptional regulator [Salipaludibacillus keqinensis]PYZ92323.1 hypothetical protein CR194_15940 [Salipaludibacillus keqinensis]